MTHRNGFTLIELMIVVAIIAILAAIGYPAYQDQVQKTRRSDGIAALSQAAQLQERWFSQNGTYSLTINDIGGSGSPEGFYTISVANPGTAGCSSNGNIYCFALTATPTGAQTNDTRCANLTLSNTGVKGNSGTLPSTDCW